MNRLLSVWMPKNFTAKPIINIAHIHVYRSYICKDAYWMGVPHNAHVFICSLCYSKIVFFIDEKKRIFHRCRDVIIYQWPMQSFNFKALHQDSKKYRKEEAPCLIYFFAKQRYSFLWICYLQGAGSKKRILRYMHSAFCCFLTTLPFVKSVLNLLEQIAA